MKYIVTFEKFEWVGIYQLYGVLFRQRLVVVAKSACLRWLLCKLHLQLQFSGFLPTIPQIVLSFWSFN